MATLPAWYRKKMGETSELPPPPQATPIQAEILKILDEILSDPGIPQTGRQLIPLLRPIFTGKVLSTPDAVIVDTLVKIREHMDMLIMAGAVPAGIEDDR